MSPFGHSAPLPRCIPAPEDPAARGSPPTSIGPVLRAETAKPLQKTDISLFSPLSGLRFRLVCLRPRICRFFLGGPPGPQLLTI